MFNLERQNSPQKGLGGWLGSLEVSFSLENFNPEESQILSIFSIKGRVPRNVGLARSAAWRSPPPPLAP